MKDSLFNIHFVRLAAFDKAAKGLLSDEDERAMEIEIATNPKAAPVITETGGVRKIRVAIKGRGKSGSARVLYLYIPLAEIVYLLFAYPKNVIDNISSAEKKAIKALVAQLKAGYKE
jgi:hypothetical protein